MKQKIGVSTRVRARALARLQNETFRAENMYVHERARCAQAREVWQMCALDEQQKSKILIWVHGVGGVVGGCAIGQMIKCCWQWHTRGIIIIIIIHKCDFFFVSLICICSHTHIVDTHIQIIS